MEDREKIRDILKAMSGKEQIAATDRLADDLLLDSLNMVFLMLEMEEKCGFFLEDGDMNPGSFVTVADLFALAEKYRQKGEEKHEQES